MKENNYFISKANDIIHRLLIGKGTPKQRLGREINNICLILKSKKFSDDLEKDKETIFKMLKERASYFEESKSPEQHAVLKMRNSTASKIIEKFYSIYCEINY